MTRLRGVLGNLGSALTRGWLDLLWWVRIVFVLMALAHLAVSALKLLKGHPVAGLLALVPLPVFVWFLIVNGEMTRLQDEAGSARPGTYLRMRGNVTLLFMIMLAMIGWLADLTP